MKRIAVTNKELVERSVLEAISEIAEIVGATLGPAGRPILIEQEPGKVLITKDGVTVGKYFQSSDPIKDLAATVARQSCERTVTQAGDGTTTAIVLARALVEAGQKFLRENPHYSPQRLARELRSIIEGKIEQDLLALSRPVRGLSPEESRVTVKHVAMVSANHDAELAEAVTEAVEYVGEDGMVVAEEGAGLKTTVDKRAGFPVSGGLHSLGGSASAAFVNRTAYEDCVLEGAYVAMYDGEINDFDTILPLLQRVAGELSEDGEPYRHPLVIVAHGFGPQVLKGMSQNFRSKDGVRCVPFISSRNGQASGKQAFLYDLAAYVGGTVFDPQVNRLQDAFPSQLGFVDKIRIAQHETVIMAEPELELVEKRIGELKDQMEGASEFDRDRIRYRIGQLTGGVATVYAGGATSIEAKERHARVVDAISAVRSAMQKGVIPGGGVALAHVSKQFEAAESTLPESILAAALKRPFTQIVLNSGHAKTQEEANALIAVLGQQVSGDFTVFDALNGRSVEWYEAGIMDPTKVTLSALSNALSVAQLLMTLGGVMVPFYSEGEATALAMQDAVLKSVQGGNE